MSMEDFMNNIAILGGMLLGMLLLIFVALIYIRDEIKDFHKTIRRKWYG